MKPTLIHAINASIINYLMNFLMDFMYDLISWT